MGIVLTVRTHTGDIGFTGKDLADALHEAEGTLGAEFTTQAEQIIAEARAGVGGAIPLHTADHDDPGPAASPHSSGDPANEVAGDEGAPTGDAGTPGDTDASEATPVDEAADEGLSSPKCVICEAEVTNDWAELSIEEHSEIRCRKCQT